MVPVAVIQLLKLLIVMLIVAVGFACAAEEMLEASPRWAGAVRHGIPLLSAGLALLAFAAVALW